MENTNKFKILDCTLRDGGYYTNWDFNKELVKTYFESFNNLPVDYLEIGYRSNPMNSYLGEFFYCPQYVLEQCKESSSKKLVIILNEKDIRPEHVNNLLGPAVSYIDMVRIAIDPKNFKRALLLAEEVKKLGFEVGFNVMYMSTWENEKEFLNQIKDVDGLADYFYMVDSFGGVYPDEVKRIFNLVKSKIDIKIGFHGHNNLELALINTLTAIDCGADIIDGTITGMGRGAGNLKLELLLTALQSKGKLEFDYNQLSKVVDAFSELQNEHMWGTNLPYMVSGANSLPQKQVMEWVSKRYYSFNSIIRALNNQSQGKEDNISLQSLSTDGSQFKEALLVGGGPSVVEHSKAVELFLRKNPDMLVIHASSKNALNFFNVSNEQLFCLVGNEGHRMENVFGERKITGKCILPPYPRKMGTYIPMALSNNAFELKRVSFTDKFQDSHTAIALQTVLDMGIEKTYVVGYDGYSGNIGRKEQELFLENKYLFDLILKNKKEFTSLTPTEYGELNQDSIYSKLNDGER